VGGVKVGRYDVIHRGILKGGGICPTGGAPHGSVMASNPDPTMGEECRKADLDTAVG
jgi:hypothetical protein